MPAPDNLPSAVIKNSFLDGIFATIFGTLTSGVFLTGLAVDFLGSVDLNQLHPAVTPLRLAFLTSTLLRLLSLQALKAVREPDEAPVGQLIRMLRNVRGLNTTNGFHALLHPFVEAPAVKDREELHGKCDGVEGL